jgi:putative transposase
MRAPLDWMVDVVTNRHRVYQTAYRVVGCPNYRRDVPTDTVAHAVGLVLDATCMGRE